MQDGGRRSKNSLIGPQLWDRPLASGRWLKHLFPYTCMDKQNNILTKLFRNRVPFNALWVEYKVKTLKVTNFALCTRPSPQLKKSARWELKGKSYPGKISLCPYSYQRPASVGRICRSIVTHQSAHLGNMAREEPLHAISTKEMRRLCDPAPWQVMDRIQRWDGVFFNCSNTQSLHMMWASWYYN